jgi:hypothetical protein
MDNGESKGGSVATLKTLRAAPGLETLWQLHFSAEGGAAWNTDEPHIANLPGTDVGNDLELDAWATGRFTVKNSRTGSVQTYAKRP